MCNPPFYTSVSELVSSAAAKSHPPRSACTGAEVEMVTDGGEVAFVQLMIKESCQLKTDCQWFTSMLGKLSSLYTVLDTLKSVAVCNWAVKEFVQGTKTRRWAIAWSFQSARPTKVCCFSCRILPVGSREDCMIYGFEFRMLREGYQGCRKSSYPFPQSSPSRPLLLC